MFSLELESEGEAKDILIAELWEQGSTGIVTLVPLNDNVGRTVNGGPSFLGTTVIITTTATQRVTASISSIRFSEKSALLRIVAIDSFGIQPFPARASHTSSSTRNQVRNLFSSDQIRAMSAGR